MLQDIPEQQADVIYRYEYVSTIDTSAIDSRILMNLTSPSANSPRNIYRHSLNGSLLTPNS